MFDLDWKKVWLKPYSFDNGHPFYNLAHNVLLAFGVFVFGVVPLHVYAYFFQKEYFELSNPLFWWMYGIWILAFICHRLKAYYLSFFIIFLGGELYLYYIASFFGKDSLIYLFLIFNLMTILVVLGRERKLAFVCYGSLAVIILFGHFTDFSQFTNPETLPYRELIADYVIGMFLVVNCLILWVSTQNVYKNEQRYKAAKDDAEDALNMQKQTEALLTEKNEELQRYIDSNLQLENFAYAASHDLREPMRTITSFSQLLLQRNHAQLDEDGKAYLDFIVEAGINMNELIQDMLAFARVNTEDVNLSRFNPTDLLGDVIRNLKAQIEEESARIEMGELPAEISGDHSKLRQLFQNLIANGIKFHQEGVPPIIKITGRTTDLGWEFCVEDNGIGIRKEFQSKIFLIFRRLHTKGQYTGSGIGLAICKKIVEQHNGKIWLESEEGKGTRFYFTLASVSFT